MLSFYNIQAVIVRMLLSFIAANTASINSKLEPILGSLASSAVLWDRFGVIIHINRKENGKWVLTLRTDLTDKGGQQIFEIQLGSDANAFNKRVLNALNVWAHANFREAADRFYDVALNGINQLDIRSYITDIGLIDRVLNKPHHHELSLGNSTVDLLIDSEITITRSLFNRLVVTVSVSSNLVSGKNALLLEKQMAVATGVLRQFVANIQQEPVNDYVRQAFTDHIEFNLK